MSLYQRLLSLVGRSLPAEQATRTVVVNHTLQPDNATNPNASHPSNRVTTTKYNLVTFIPKNLFEQFHRFANIYFLFIVLLNFVPSINAFAKEVAMLPLLFVLSVTALKDLFEDRRRYNSDKRVNNSSCRVYCRCLDDDNFDVQKLNFSVEISPPTTKIYHFLGSIPVAEGTRRIALNESNLLLRSCFVKNTDFVEGLVVYAGSETKVMLNSSSSRYKRSRLERHMNTSVVCCVAILLVMCFLSATGSGVWQAYFDKVSAGGVVPFLPPVMPSLNGGGDALEELVRGEVSEDASPAVRRLSTSPGWVAFLSFWTFVIIFQVIIPIALYVTIEIIKMLQVYHIQNDPCFVDARNGSSIECRAMNITEELGQVQYVFTDKTGTLTENNMVFQRCSINGVDYEHQITTDKLDTEEGGENCGDSFEINKQLYDDLHRPAPSGTSPGQQQDPSPSLMYHQRRPLPDPAAPDQQTMQQQQQKQQQEQQSLQRHLHQQHPEVHQERILNFMLTLVLCNTVIVAKTPHRDKPATSGSGNPPTPGVDDYHSVITPSRLIPSLRAFTPLIRIPPLPERPYLNLRSLNPFNRPLSPIASSPTASPEVCPKHHNAGNTKSPAIFMQHDGKNPSLQFVPATLLGGENSAAHFNLKDPTPSLGSQSLVSELGGPDSEMSSCATFCTDVPLDSSLTPATEILSFSSSSADGPHVMAANVSARHSTPGKELQSSVPAKSVTSASNVFNSSSLSVSKASDDLSSSSLSPSQMNWAYKTPCAAQSTNLPLMHLTLNPLSDSAGDATSRIIAPELAREGLCNSAFISSTSESSLGSSRAPCSVYGSAPSNSSSEERFRHETRLTPPNTLKIPLGRIYAPRSPLKSSRRTDNSSYSSSSLEASSVSGETAPVPDKDELLGVTKEEPKPLYEAESPDELALVEAAFKYGVRLLRRDAHTALVDVPGAGVLQFEVLHVFPFDSTRKRMSVMVRDPRTKSIILYCKGADSAILDNLDRVGNQLDQFRQFRTHQHLYVYSKKGLRTLCVATRHVSEAEYLWWRRGHDEAEASFADREFKLQNSYKLMEKSLTLLGATGIEDRLQPLVPETLEALRAAGIVVWLLTGDKQETAINVAHSAALFSPTMQIMKVNATTQHAEETMRRFLESCGMRARRPRQAPDDDDAGSVLSVTATDVAADNVHASTTSMTDVSSSLMAATCPDAAPDDDKERGLVVDGKTLTFILDRRTSLGPLFLELAGQCRSVLISRATPLQKALVVKLAKRDLGVLSMAVGDGANDVSMIQTADVGVGISGVEGRQAVMCSDFAISRFCHLQRLLLLHGHWCHHRLASIILYFFYKNANLVLVLLWYQFYCSFTGNNFMDQMYLIQFSLTFTSVPPVIVGAYDKDAPSSVLLSEPHLYDAGRLDQVFKHSYFWVNILDAAFQSIVMFFFALGAYYGGDSGGDLVALTVVHSCLLGQLLTIALEIKSWTILHVASLVFSLVIFHVFSMAYTMSCVACFGLQSVYWVYPHAMTSPLHWCVVILSSITAVLPRFVYRCGQTSLWPTAVQTSVLRYRRLQRQRRLQEKLAGQNLGCRGSSTV
ncbi:phospholipid-transporting ATPase VD [Hyalella azteca]|uniref:Phospholipid-transporting ATPase n=1 Tax=Hyalella azteca TaxID=294128 RepID=A0A8B7PM00_HYAAZ|nr:phospholipid-transporting ATPase VD [Hyalella azteca]